MREVIRIRRKHGQPAAALIVIRRDRRFGGWEEAGDENAGGVKVRRKIKMAGFSLGADVAEPFEDDPALTRLGTFVETSAQERFAELRRMLIDKIP